MLDRQHLVEKLALILLRLRTRGNEDLGVSAADKLYVSSIPVPRKFFGAMEGAPTAAVAHLCYILGSTSFDHTPPRGARGQPVFSFPTMDAIVHALLRRDSIKLPFTHSYEGPLHVISRSAEKLKIDVRGKVETVSFYTAKPVHIEH